MERAAPVGAGEAVPALLAGCTAILKLAPETALDGQYLGELFAEAGLPEGVLSIVAADRDVSEHLVAHPGIDKIAFTGSTAAGRRIARLQAISSSGCRPPGTGRQVRRHRARRCGYRADGRDAAICELPEQRSVLRRADPRILVPEDRHDALVEALVSVVKEGA